MKKLLIILMMFFTTSLFAQNAVDVSYSASTESYSLIYTFDKIAFNLKITPQHLLAMNPRQYDAITYQRLPSPPMSILASGLGYSHSILDGKLFIVGGLSQLVRYEKGEELAKNFNRVKYIKTFHPYICGGVMLNVAKDLNVMISYEYIGIFDASLGIGFNF